MNATAEDQIGVGVEDENDESRSMNYANDEEQPNQTLRYGPSIEI